MCAKLFTMHYAVIAAGGGAQQCLHGSGIVGAGVDDASGGDDNRGSVHEIKKGRTLLPIPSCRVPFAWDRFTTCWDRRERERKK